MPNKNSNNKLEEKSGKFTYPTDTCTPANERDKKIYYEMTNRYMREIRIISTTYE